jgi:hypothetical protein
VADGRVSRRSAPVLSAQARACSSGAQVGPDDGEHLLRRGGVRAHRRVHGQPVHQGVQPVRFLLDVVPGTARSCQVLDQAAAAGAD